MPRPGSIDRRSLLLSVAALSACQREQAQFQGVDLTGASYAQELALTDHLGRPRTLRDFRGKVLVVFFGYTQCPDVCPTTLGELALVKQQLGAQGQEVLGLFVTVDPERDTPELLKAYIEAFGPGMLALRGTPEQTKAAAQAFKVIYAKAPAKEGGGYTMDHTAASFLFDRHGRVRVYMRYGQGAAALSHDLRILLAES